MIACPWCSKEMDLNRYAGLGRKERLVPRERDLVLCSGCAGLCLFTADLKLRRPSFDEADYINGHPEIGRLVRRMRKAMHDAHSWESEHDLHSAHGSSG